MLIGISGRARHGKSSIGKALAARLRVTTMAFADPIRAIVGDVFGWDAEEIEYRKDQPDIRGVVPRRAMQTLGTEWGRALYANVWVDMGMRRARAEMRTGVNVAFTDVRFPEEAHAIEREGGIVVRVVREGVTALDHPSEAALDGWAFEHVIANDGTLHELGHRAVAWFENQQWVRKGHK